MTDVGGARMNDDDAVTALDAIDAANPMEAHADADADYILLACVSPEVRAAYERLVKRTAWWVTA